MQAECEKQKTKEVEITNQKIENMVIEDEKENVVERDEKIPLENISFTKVCSLS